MAVKTITIDLEAYGLLARCKRDGLSFSDVIKEHFGRPLTVGEFKARMRRQLEAGRRMRDETLEAIEDVIRTRKDDPVRYPKP
ncbi:MAG TPA: antitoxin VapB family protein [Vicinamibacterales bacterium]|jgi:predicted CopG family antitoxin|nr:antitoxin VapB family protein [Vicinamibacterales bacterium]